MAHRTARVVLFARPLEKGSSYLGWLRSIITPLRETGSDLVSSVKYEDIYLRDYAAGSELRSGLARCFRFYNTARPHQALGKPTPGEVHFG